jgi:hypothetical protein
MNADLERLAIMADSDPYMNQVCTLADAYQPRKPLQYLIDGLFSPGVVAVFGAPGSLKSMLMQSALVSVAGGLPWLGRPSVQCPTMWIDLDNGKRRTHERIEALARGARLDESAPLYYLSMPTPWLDAGNAKDLTALGERILSLGILFVVIDNLGLISPGADENSADMIRVLGNLRALSERTGACIVLIHHQRKSTGISSRAGESLRGHSSIEASIDLALLVKREEGSNVVVIRSAKTRDVDVLPFAAEFHYEHKPGTFELARAGFAAAEIQDTAPDARPLTGARKIAFDALDGGRVHIDAWRLAAYRAGISPTSSQDAKRKAFKRAALELRNAGWVDTDGEYWWPDRPDTSRTLTGHVRGHRPDGHGHTPLGGVRLSGCPGRD